MSNLPDFNGPQEILESYRQRLGEGAPNTGDSLARMHARMAAAKSKAANKPNVWNRWSISAAVFATCVLAIAGVPYIVAKVETVKPQAAKTYTTQPGQRAKIQLADGTRITLAPGTTLRANGRNIGLNGEATFNVIQHADNPFQVKANNATIKVLGTTFNVRAYSADKSISVAVGDGRVSVSSVVLVAGQGAEVSRNGSVTSMSDARVIAALGRASGRLIFEHAPVEDVMKELSRWYGVDFVLKDAPLKQVKLSTTIDEPAINDALIHSLALALQSRVSRNGHTITFFRK